MNSSEAPQADFRIEEFGTPVPYFDAEAWAASTAKHGDWFDEAAAEHACAFFPRYLRHTKGKWAGQPFHLEPWQRSIVRAIFGWKKADGTRRFRIVFIEVGRKNGKTGLAAGIMLYLAFASGEAGAEVYCAANDTKQAAICFNEAKRMRSLCPWLSANTEKFKFNISDQASYSKLEVLSAEVGTKDGLNASGFVYDELHASKDRGLYDVLHTSVGARDQPMEILITTAGDDMISLWGETHEHAEHVRDQVIDDHEFMPVIYAADPDDDIEKRATWIKANPSLDVTIKSEYLAKEAARARQQPRYLNTFKRLHLNIMAEKETAWISMENWDACSQGAESVSLAALAGRKCYAAIDLSSTTDLTALGLIFPRDDGPGVDFYAHFWMPSYKLGERVKKDKVPYDLWADQGFITLTEGNVVDYDMIRAFITGQTVNAADAEAKKRLEERALTNQVEIVEFARDRWNATQITTQLMGDGVNMVEFGQGFASMSAPSKEFEKLILAGNLNHGGNPVLRWMASVVTIKTDDAGNIKPVKPNRLKSVKRIDGIVAGIMGLGRCIANPVPAKSFWDSEEFQPGANA